MYVRVCIYVYRLMYILCTYSLFTQGNKQCAYVKIFIRFNFFQIYNHISMYTPTCSKMHECMHLHIYICICIHTIKVDLK